MVVHRNTVPWASSSSSQQQQQYFYDNSQSQIPQQQQQQEQPYPYYYEQWPSAQFAPPQQQNVYWTDTFNMRKENLKSIQMCKQRRMNFRGPNEDEPALVAKSLNLTRQNLQNAINIELDSVIGRYIEKFFHPAIENLKSNLGVNAVNEDHIKTLCRAILEEAKQMYMPACQSRANTPVPESSNLENSRPGYSARRCKQESEIDLEASQSVINKKKAKSLHTTVQRATKSENLKREAPKWDPERINKETLFVMGSRANKAMGFGLTRGRLYIKHPEVFRYSGDHEDKEWLVRHSLMPPTGLKTYIMIVNDIIELANTPEYKDSASLMLHEVKGFEAPDFMVQKIKNFMQHMRTDLPGGHRRYKRSISAVNQTEALVPQIDLDISQPPIQQHHQLAPANNMVHMPNNTIINPHQHYETIGANYLSHIPTAEITNQQINETLQQMAAHQITDPSLINQTVQLSVLWDTSNVKNNSLQ